MTQITLSQLDAFADSLVKAGRIQKSDIELYKYEIEQSLRDSLSGCLPVQIDPRLVANGEKKYRHIYDAVEIFDYYLESNRNEKRAKQEQQHRLLDDALRDWNYYDQHTPATERYNTSLGIWITKDYFILNPYICPSSTKCNRRFTTEEEAKKHAYRHYATVT